MGGLSAFSQLLGPASATGPGFLTTSAQTIAGAKTFNGAMVINQTAISGAETPLTVTISDDATGKFEIKNGASGAGVFLPYFVGTSGGVNEAIAFRGIITTDSGAVPAVYFQAFTAAVAAITTRPLFIWRNLTTNVMALAADGGLSISGGTAPGLTLGATGTKITQTKVYTQTITPASVAANTTAVQTFTVTGLTTADKVSLNHGAAQTAGIGIAGVRVSAADTLEITFANNTAGALTPVSSTCLILATRS